MEFKTDYKYAVIGCGGIGSAALYRLAKKCGTDVLGIEQFELGHNKGGSQDHSRSIRLVYHDEIYNALTPEAFKAWEELEDESGIQILHRTGGLVIAEKGVTEDVIHQYIRDIESKHLPYELMTGSQLSQKYPQFTTDDSVMAVYQKDIGIVDAQTANALHVQLARGHGATVVENCPVSRLCRSNNGRIEITTAKGTFTCDRVIVTAGAWINKVLGSIGVHLPIYVTQEQVSYFATPTSKYLTKDRLPIWIYHSKDHDIYGLSIYGSTGFKVGLDVDGPLVTADTRTFTPDPKRETISRQLLENILPSAVGPILATKTCLYTMPPDRHFIIDTCKKYGFDDVIVCNGAGHAFKFAGVLGKILSEMATDGSTSYDVKDKRLPIRTTRRTFILTKDTRIYDERQSNQNFNRFTYCDTKTNRIYVKNQPLSARDGPENSIILDSDWSMFDQVEY